MADISTILFTSLVTFLNIYLAILFVRILLSWFPNVDWSNPFFSAIMQLTDPYLNLFRSIIPPIGGLDLSAILAIILLQVLASVVGSLGSTVTALVYNASLG
ncbi:MAG: YggT family protein [Phormidesmis sp.]